MENNIFGLIFSSLIKIIADALMVFCPALSYFSQALKFKKTKSSKGFSKTLSLLLLLTNILRIYFWIAKPFSIALLYQSILVSLTHLYLMHIFLKFQDISEKNIVPKKTLIEHIVNWKDVLNPLKLWNYDYEIDYYKFLFFFILIFSILCLIIGFQETQFFEIVGTISVSIEIFIEIPQIKENYVTKNTKNISTPMVLMWLVGDLFKTFYNFIYKSPIQLIGGNLIQITEDLIIIVQLIKYGDLCSSLPIFTKKYKSLKEDDNEEEEENNKKIDDNNSLIEDISVLDTENNSEIQMDNLKEIKDEIKDNIFPPESDKKDNIIKH